jgi:hypothetical protein
MKSLVLYYQHAIPTCELYSHVLYTMYHKLIVGRYSDVSYIVADVQKIRSLTDPTIPRPRLSTRAPHTPPRACSSALIIKGSYFGPERCSTFRLLGPQARRRLRPSIK